METLKDFYTVKELAALLNLIPDTIRQRIKKGTLKAVKLNGAYLIEKAEAERVLAEKQR